MERTILIVDDHAEFRRAARALLQSEGFDVVGEAADGASALTSVDALAPALVLLDIQLPDMDGFEVAERLALRRDAPAVILISSREASEYGPRLASAPARGFISKRRISGAAIATILG